MNGHVYKWLAGALLTALLVTTGWAYGDLTSDVEKGRDRLDFYLTQLSEIKADIREIKTILKERK